MDGRCLRSNVDTALELIWLTDLDGQRVKTGDWKFQNYDMNTSYLVSCRCIWMHILKPVLSVCEVTYVPKSAML